MAKITRNDIIRLASLNRLKLTEKEITQYQSELESVFEYIAILNSVDITGLEPSYQVSGLKNVMREDKIVNYEASPKELLDSTPSSKNGYIKVGRMI